jgi:ornithine cyclodeaminase/alanine dehydrogenase-like protein (mu-crystallin family)
MIKIKIINDESIKKAIGDDLNLVTGSVVDAFKSVIDGKANHPVKTRIARPSKKIVLDDWIFSMPAYISDIENIAGVKWASRYPGSSDGNVHILLILNETNFNKPIAIMDGMHISHLRTFAISKLSIDLLNLQPKEICIIGMGSLGRMHAIKLKEIYPSIKKIKCFSTNAKYEDITDEKIMACKTLNDALDLVDIVITCGQKRPPYINMSMISENTKLIVNLSLFDFDESVFNQSDIVFVDDINAAYSSSTPLGKMMRNGELDETKIKKIGQYLLNKEKLPQVKKFVLVNTLGMVAQDLILASRVLKRLKDMQFNTFEIM